MDKISIIIHVYNVEENKSRCLDSVINQTYKNLEIIVVGDELTEGSNSIYNEYAARDSRIKVFNTEHGSNTAAVRNIGLEHITGKYVGFVDSYDWIEPDMYEKLLTAIEGVDIAVCSFFWDTSFSSAHAKNMKKIRAHTISTRDMLIYPLMRDYYAGFCGYPWNKLFRTELFDGLQFDESINRVSGALTYTEIVKRNNAKGRYIDEPLYHYFASREEAVAEADSVDMLKVCKEIETFLDDKDKYLTRGLYCHYTCKITEFVISRRDGETLKRKQKEIRAFYKDYRRVYRHFPDKLKRIDRLIRIKLVNRCSYDINKFEEQTAGKTIVCFGAYTQFGDWVVQNPDSALRIISVIDNGKNIQGSTCDIGNKKVTILSMEKFLKRYKLNSSEYVVVINTARHYDSIIEQLELSGGFEDVDVYVAQLRKYKNDDTIKKVQQVELELLNEFVRVCEKNNLTYHLIGGTLLGAARHKGFIPWDDDIDVTMPVRDFDKFVNLPKQEFGDDYFLHWINTDKHCVDVAAHLRKRSTFRMGWAKGYETANDMNNAIGICIFREIFTSKSMRYVGSGREGSKYDLFWMDARNKLQRVAYKKLDFCPTAPRTIFSLLSLPTVLKIRELIIRYFLKSDSGYWLEKPGNQVYGKGVPLEFEGRIYNAPSDWEYYVISIYGGNYMQLPPPEKRFSHCPRALSFDVESGVYEQL